MNIEINYYKDRNGNSPYKHWLERLKEGQASLFIILQVNKLGVGLSGDSQPIGIGLSELRIHYGPGYRVYYARESKSSILILCGGKKSSQKKDISAARGYWRDYRSKR
jgi:putative addiction module killer protein